MIYRIEKKETIEFFQEKGIPVINVENIMTGGWGDVENLRDFFRSIKREINISYVNDIVLELPRRKLKDWIDKKKYVHLGDHYEVVEKWAIERGYCPLLTYKTIF